MHLSPQLLPASASLSSPLLTSEYERRLPEYEDYRNRLVKVRDAADLVAQVAAG